MHRYCARMTGSSLDGEDLMQEAIFEAYLKLGSFDATRPLGPWLLRIAHNRCIDFLRRRQGRREVEAEAATTASFHPSEAVGRGSTARSSDWSSRFRQKKGRASY
jgi:RNA polymerase sigma-70 factor, ECF subfamily